MDSKFQIKTLRSTANPQQLCWQAMHQDYSSEYVASTPAPTEARSGELVVKHLLAGSRGHYGPLEHPQITLACGYFPHSVMQQLRTHRIGITFDCQSFRYTGEQIIAVADEVLDAEYAFYLRPVGDYSDRQGNKYHYSEGRRQQDLRRCLDAAKHYREAVEAGMPMEQARGLLPFDYRQHFVISANSRSLMHLLDLRAKADAQLECQWFCDLLIERFTEWMPDIAGWYRESRMGRARLSP